MAATHDHARLRQLSGDPSGTHDIREDLLRDIGGRFRRLRGLVRAAAGYEHDVFELSGDDSAQAARLQDGRERDRDDIPERVYEFDTDPAKAQAFLSWLGRKVESIVLKPLALDSVRDGDHWTGEYIRRVYSQSWKQARNRLRQEGVDVGPEVNPFNLPTSRRQLKRLYTRTYRNLESVTADIADPVRETLTDGLAKGENPRKIADRLTDEIATIEKTQAEVLARTEIINSHSTATLDRYDRSAVDGVQVSGEFATAKDTRVCPICESIEGTTYTTDEMREETFIYEPSEREPDYLRGEYPVKPPIHCNCRCTILPVIA